MASLEVEAEPGPDDVGRADGFLTLPVGQGEAGLELLGPPRVGRSRRSIRVAMTSRVSEFARFLLDVRRAPAEPPHHLRLSREPQVEVAQQPALADPGVADDVDDEIPTLVDDVEEPLLEELDLAGPADRARLDALDDAELVQPEPRVSLGHDEPGVHRNIEALELQAGHRVHVERPADLAVRLGRHEHAPPARPTAGGWRG